MARLNAAPERQEGECIPTAASRGFAYCVRAQANTTTVTLELSPPPSSRHTPSDDEAASEQILAESLASASRAPKAPQSSAILGASLLNAARVDFQHSSPLPKARKKANGKLSRPSWGTDRPRLNLARRGDEYELHESPEKGSFKLPETMNRKPLKIVGKQGKPPEGTSTVQQQNLSESSGPVTEENDTGAGAIEQQKQQEVEQEIEPVNSDHDIDLQNEARIPSSPPVPAPVHMASDIQIELRLSNGRARCTMLSYSNDARKGIGYHQCARAETERTKHGSRCSRHLHKPGLTRCEHMTKQDTDLLQCHSPALAGMTRCSKHAATKAHVDRSSRNTQQQDNQQSDPVSEADDTSPSTSKRKSEDVHEDEDRPGKVLKGTGYTLERHTKKTALSDTTTTKRVRSRGTALITIPVRKSKNQRSAKEHVISEKSPADQEEHVAPSIEVDIPVPAASSKSTRSNAPTTHASKSTTNRPRPTKQSPIESVSTSSKPAVSASEARETEDGGADGEKDSEDDEAEAKETSTQTARMPGTFEQVFAFLDLDERSGTCQTEIGVSIKCVCDDSCAEFDNDLSIEDVTETVNDVCEVLKKTCGVEEDDRPAFKCDAYAYIFRSLTRYLDALHRWLLGRSDDLTCSPEALKLLSPLVNDILAFKDTIASWKVSIPQRYQGDRIIKDVDVKLVAPLRAVASSFRRKLSQLESKEQSREKLAELDRQADEQEVEAIGREEALAARKERWKVWQELHIKRMQCEPDPRARRKLVITKLDDPEETDANGIPFERLPVFKSRVTLSTRPASSKSTEVVWTDAQITALIDGLKSFAGMFCVLAV
jgi:hypothetical protein